MFQITIAYVTSLAIMIALDAAWLSNMVPAYYKPRIGSLLLEQPVWWAAIVFYLIYTAGVVVFAVLPGLQTQSWMRTATLGAVLGGVAYATYDLTNQATLRGWSSVVTMLDLGWGIVLTATAASVAYFVASRWG